MKILQKGLIIEGVFSFLLAIVIFITIRSENIMYILTLPFDLIGGGLRWLSLSSTVGNIIALLIYFILSLTPVFYLLARKLKNGLRKPDVFLPVISIFLFYMLYEFVNPGLMLNKIPEIFADKSCLPLIKTSFTYIFYTLCIGYFVTNMLDHLTLYKETDKTHFLYQKLQLILIVFSAIYTFVLGYFMIYHTMLDFKLYLGKSNVAINCMFAILSYLSDGLPILFSILILYASIQLVEAIKTKHMQEEEISAAVQLGIISKRTVLITVICDISFNLLQFLLSKQLSNMDFSLRISFIPLIISFAAFILSGLFTETKKLHDDNEMII